MRGNRTLVILAVPAHIDVSATIVEEPQGEIMGVSTSVAAAGR